MEKMEHGDLTLDAYHFGGCNTVSDSLFARVPIICWEGDQWYNRIGPSTLRMAGMHECIATSADEYIALAVRLIEDVKYRKDLRERLVRSDLDTLLYGKTNAVHFNTAIHYLIANHDRLQQNTTREPIRIPGR